MQSHVIKLLLNAYLHEHAQSIDLNRFVLPSLRTPDNAFLALENIYQSIQQSLKTKTDEQQEKSEKNDDEQLDNEIVLSDNSQITITVCDEAKNAKRQFPCNRSLLIREMRYFADHLKEPDQLEEVDISVHCDLDIFQWLMAFVTRHQTQKPPVLETRFAISILISSDFLKMDKLVALSLDFIHQHINEIIAISSTLSTVSDNVFRQLAKRFDDPLEIELVQDRRNRVRNKFFEYNLEFLLTKTKLIRCQHCSMIMSLEQLKRMPCLNDRLIIQSNGQIQYQHRIDPKFDVNQWVKEVHANTDNSSRKTFWIVWLHINGDQCARCQTYFRFIDLPTCRYHPSSNVNQDKFDCCSQATNRFDVIRNENSDFGCQQRDHVCQTQNRTSEILESIDKNELIKSNSKYQSSIRHGKPTDDLINRAIEQSIFGTTLNEAKKGSVRFQWTPQLDTGSAAALVKFSWDATKSTRWNQDAQREDEHRRFEAISRSISAAQQNNKNSSHRSLKESGSASTTATPGIYFRIEHEWKNRQTMPMTMNKTRQRTSLK